MHKVESRLCGFVVRHDRMAVIVGVKDEEKVKSSRTFVQKSVCQNVWLRTHPERLPSLEGAGSGESAGRRSEFDRFDPKKRMRGVGRKAVAQESRHVDQPVGDVVRHYRSAALGLAFPRIALLVMRSV